MRWLIVLIMVVALVGCDSGAETIDTAPSVTITSLELREVTDDWCNGYWQYCAEPVDYMTIGNKFYIVVIYEPEFAIMTDGNVSWELSDEDGDIVEYVTWDIGMIYDSLTIPFWPTDEVALGTYLLDVWVNDSYVSSIEFEIR